MISPIGRALPHEPFADVVSDIEIRCRVQPQQLHEFPKIFVEKSSGLAIPACNTTRPTSRSARGICERRKENRL
jgi:hypothetical protein